MTRPKRPRTSRIEDVNQRALEDALGEFFVYRELRRDIGVDGQVEIFDGDDTTGLTFDVQLRATDAKDERRARGVRLRHGQVEYWRSRQGPTLIVRYLGANGKLYARWLHSFDRYYDGDPSDKTLPLPMRDEDLLDEARRDRLAAEVEAYRHLQRAALALPLSIRCAAEGAELSHAELLMTLRAANSTPDVLDIGAQPGRPQDLRLVAAADHLSVELAGVTGATMHVATASVPSEQIARELLALCAMAFATVGQPALAGRMAHVYLSGSVLAQDADSVLALSSAMAQARQVREALELAEGLDELGGEAADNSSSLMLVALVHARALSETESRQRLATFEARIKRRIATGDSGGAATEAVSLANAQRHVGEHGRALAALERALRLDPGYADRAHFFDERAATRFLAGRYREAADDYRRAVELGAEHFTRALAADATLYSGSYAEAEDGLREYLAAESDPVRAAEYQLKLELCRELSVRGIVRQARRTRQAERLADRAAKAEGPQASRRLADEALAQDGLCSLAWFNLAVALREAGEERAAVARAWLCAAVTMEWDPTVWADALLIASDDELILPLLLTARRMTSGAVFGTLAKFARERGLQEMLERLPQLIDSLPPERDDAVAVRAIAGGEVEHLSIPSRTSPAPAY